MYNTYPLINNVKMPKGLINSKKSWVNLYFDTASSGLVLTNDSKQSINNENITKITHKTMITKK